MASKKSNGLVWILMALLILGLGGFGATSFTGGVNSIAKVGDKQVRIDNYTREVQVRMNQLGEQLGEPVSFADAEGFGLPNAVLSTLITNRALDVEAERLGLSVGDGTLRDQIVDIPNFQGPDGSFSRDSYTFVLERAGLSEEQFEGDLRDETARSVLQAAVTSAMRMPDLYADTVINYLAEVRSITMLRLNQDDLDAPLPTPTEAELRDFYQENQDDYTAPEKKRITYAWLSPDEMIDQIPIEPEAIRDAYEARIDEFEQPERRLVERLVYPDAEAAEAARAQLDAGEAEFETLVEDRGLALSDVDLGDVSRADLGAAAEPVFSAESGDVVGPVESDLGPALFRVNGVLAANTTDYQTASMMIREELAADAARRKVQQMSEPAADLLAGGATLEELADETDMRLGTIDWYPGLSEGIAGYADFEDAAQDLQADDYPEVLQLDDGGIFAMRLEEVIPAAPAPFEEVRDRVSRNWEAAQTDSRLQARAEEILAEVEAGATLEDAAESRDLELETEIGVSRNGSVLGTPEGFNGMVFDMDPEEVRITGGFGSVLVARLDRITAPDPQNDGVTQLRERIIGSASGNLAQQVYEAYATEIRNGVDIRIDQDALNAVNTQLQ